MLSPGLFREKRHLMSRMNKTSDNNLYDLSIQYRNSKGAYGGRDKNIHYVTKKEIVITALKNKGVRRENIIYKIQSNQKYASNMLEYSRPCVCGSTTHFSFTHVDCILNDQYDDAVT